MNTFNIAFFADSHLGYRAKVRSNENGINIRVQDGYDAFRETIKQIIESDIKIDAVVHGGDLFHYSKPTIRDIATAQFYLRELAKRGIPFYGLAGNHDATDIRSELAAVAAVNDPDKNIHALYEPYARYNIGDGIVLHSVAHHGLGAEEAPKVIPVSDSINLFTTHGAALDPKNKDLMRCADSPREQMIPVELIIDDAFAAKMLGHYHNRYAVGGDILKTYYSGSSIRRGFSDDAGDRGWLLFKISPDGSVDVEGKNIKQRSQFDLDVIDAVDLSASNVMDLLEVNIARTQDSGDEPIVRQRIVNANRNIREGLDRDRIKELSSHMLLWQLEFIKPELESNKNLLKSNSLSLASRHTINIVDQYKNWAEEQSKNVPEEYRDSVLEDAEKFLKQARDLSLLEGGSH
jgi:DNA repair exonuclease SbcCD nuclease subunit